MTREQRGSRPKARTSASAQGQPAAMRRITRRAERTITPARGEREAGDHKIRNSGVVLKVRTVDADGPPADVLLRIRRLAEEIRRDRVLAITGRAAVA